MMPMPSCRITWGVIGTPPPYGDVGMMEAVVDLHPYLYDYPCGHRLYHGITSRGAAIYWCKACLTVLDQRRVD